MQAYTGFAQVYDIFMDNVPYDAWTDYLAGLLQEYGVKEGLVLELGCGTGKVTRRLALKGYDMIGIDLSDEMLEIAREKEYEEDSWSEDSEYYDSETLDKEQNETESPESVTSQNIRKPILYLQQDMREFELYGTVNAAVSICDSMNYITSEEDLMNVFKLVNNYLEPGGIFIFDMNTEYKYKNLLGDNTIAENREDCSFIWENYYDAEKQINEYNMTIFVKIEDETENDYVEVHDQWNQSDEDDESEENGYDSENKGAETEKDGDDSKDYGDDSEDRGVDYEDNCDNDADAGYNQIFTRFQETHYQKAYPISKVTELLDKAGMEFVAVYDAFTKNQPSDISERVYFIVKEKYQENKKYIEGNERSTCR
jgi:SAM-dependent methyltransferase